MYEMKDEYLTGIQQIDEEHTHLFEIAENLYQLLQEQFLSDKYDQLTAQISELKDYTKYHFANEEAYMESILYKRMFTQKIQHQEFIDFLNDFDLDNYETQEEQDEAVAKVLDFVTDWLVRHILEQDKLIAK